MTDSQQSDADTGTRTFTRIVLPLVAAVGLVGALAGCSSTTSTPADSSTDAMMMTSSPSASAAGTSNEGVITIADFAFSPSTVKAGQMVTVTNADSADHTLTITGTDVDVQVPGNGSATFTAPSKAGTYDLTCDFHGSMKGQLVVTA